MIYSISPERYPATTNPDDELTCKDTNDFSWRLSLVRDGFYIKFEGDEYFKETFFSCNLSNGSHVLLKNTGCLFIENVSVEIRYKTLQAIKTKSTDEIWEMFNGMFVFRLNRDPGIYDNELAQ